jgi:hypothetical protein
MTSLKPHHPTLQPGPAGFRRRPASLSAWGASGLFFLALCSFLVLQAEARLGVAAGGVLQRGEGSGASRPVLPQGSQRPVPGAGDAGQFQRIEEKNGQISAEYGCRNFNNDPLRASYTISSRDLAAYKQGYGYAPSELEALNQWQKKALDDAYHTALQNHLKQEELNRMGAAVKAEYRNKYRSLLVSRGFAILPGNVLAADIPAIARRNVKELRPFAQALGKTAEQKGYDSSEIVGAVLSLVQTAFLYEPVPMLVNGRQTGGVYPPLETVARGRGDCDTKSALLASILLNWGKMKLLGVGVPDHYLMAVLRNPGKGDAFVEYEGLRYVLMEPAGPAWLPPGVVGPLTTAMLNAGTSVALEPLTTN